MSNRPRIFFSYSTTKTKTPKLVENAIEAMKKRVLARGWEVVDPMEPDIIGIRDKVEHGLWNADGAIIEATTSSPNVMFEAGFVRAFNHPCLFLIDPTAFDNPEMKEYFEFLGLHPQRMVPPDLGDIEYLRYPSRLHADGDWSDFGKRADLYLDRFQQILSSEAVLARRSTKAVQRRTIEFLDKHEHRHPLIGFLGGRLAMLADGFHKEGPNVFQTDARNYQDCLAAFDASERREELQARAVADRTEPVEQFWSTDTDPLKTLVAERIFLVHWRTFFDDDELDKLTRLLQTQRQHYPVRVARRLETDGSLHIFRHHDLGADMLLMEPDVVAGYITEGSAKKLRVQRDRALYKAGTSAYQSILARSIEVTPGMRPGELRRAWLESENIGQWDPSWGESEQRPASYFEKYDQHIRCWIPQYEDLVRHCAAITQRAVVQRMRQSDSPMNVMEVGYGTGALTQRLTSWIDNLNAPVDALHKPIVSHYIGIDSAERMKEYAQQRFARKKPYHLFAVCRAPSWTDSVRDYAPYDVICGSLVFHDMVTGGTRDTLNDVIQQFGEITKASGYLIFADIFVASEPATRDVQVAQWRAWMRNIGLSEEEVEVFIEGNPEMINTVTREELDDAARDNGFRPPEFSPIPGAKSWSPFKVMKMQKEA